MDSVIQQLDSLRRINPTSITHWVDIILVTFLIYRVLLLIRGTRAWRLMFGIAAFVILLGLSKVIQLNTLSYILDRATTLGPVALVILFLPELRQALEGFGKLLPQRIGIPEISVESNAVERIVASASEMSEGRIGAIIVIEREAHLDSIVANGTRIDAEVSAPLLVSIFFEGNPLHDGAVVIRGSRIIAAACRLPNSDSSRIDNHLHMRHRAAVGVTESNDCLAVVVSEERGIISLAMDGRIQRLEGSDELRSKLNQFMRGGEGKRSPKRKNRDLKRRRGENDLDMDEKSLESEVNNEAEAAL